MNLVEKKKVVVIGAGLAGSECAYFLANQGLEVVLIESKGIQLNPAQKMTSFAELVCTNSLKSMAEDSGHGMLKFEMEGLNSLVLKLALETKVPAGDALAVDREKFSQLVTQTLKNHPKISVRESEVTDPVAIQNELKADAVVVATGPLTTNALASWIQKELSDGDDFYFYDAIAPVVDADTLDLSKMYFKDRHKVLAGDEEIQADYLNSPMNKEEYERFIQALVSAEKTASKDFEEFKYFEACLPIDTMAERGHDTPRFSCMKPIGLELPDGSMPYACVQLRKENLLGSAYNLVGFQTRLTYKEQIRVFRMIPGMENASFIHLGSVHRNSFLHAKKLLHFDMSSKKYPWLYFAGQITGVEGYTESASSGLYVAYQLLRKLKGLDVLEWPKETTIGALVNYVMTADRPAPSNINMGLLPPVTLSKEQRRDRKNIKKHKKKLVSERQRLVFDQWKKEYQC